MAVKPKLIAFDLDYTLWPFWVDTHVDPPFMLKDGKVVDYRDKKVKPYPEVTEVLKKLHSEGYIIAIASRTSEIDGANQLMKLYEWDQYVSHKEIYPGTKDNHFRKIKQQSGVEFSEMLFFDDEERNKIDMDHIGVHMYLIDNGVSKSVVKKGLEEFARLRS